MDVKMDNRLDIIVLGATGFTGKHVAKNLLDYIKGDCSDLTWGIAGRSEEKLQNLLKELQECGADTSKIAHFVCDITNDAAITALTRSARLVMNATGPYEKLSAAVVKACLMAGTDYVDISAELHHMLSIYRTFNKTAEDAGILVVPGCGFSAIPATAGLIHLEKNFNGVLHTVECYTELGIPKRAYFPGPGKALVHYGTWESLVHVLENFRESQRLKQESFPDIEPVPEKIKKSFFHRHNGKVWIPYPGPDQDIINISQSYLHQKDGRRPYHFKAYVTFPLLIHLLIIVPAFMFYYYASYFKCFRNLLWKYPGFFTLGYFSHKGPSESMRKDMKYSFTLNGKGWESLSDTALPYSRTLSVKVSGNDPGYRTTADSFICAAITMLKERSKMPKGGVITTGSAFINTEIVDLLVEHDMKIEIVENKT